MPCHIIAPKPETNVPGNKRKFETHEELVEKAVKGDSHALYSLCEKLAGSILYHTRSILGNEMDAEDVTQNVLLRMCENIKGLREIKAFRTWLGGIEINETRRFMSEHAKHINVVNIEDHAEGLREDRVESLPRSFVEEKCPDRYVMEVVSSLPLRQREAVMLRYFDDLGVTEVAPAMKISHQNASRYLNLAQKKLRKKLEEKPYAERASKKAFLHSDCVVSKAIRSAAFGSE